MNTQRILQQRSAYLTIIPRSCRPQQQRRWNSQMSDPLEIAATTSSPAALARLPWTPLLRSLAILSALSLPRPFIAFSISTMKKHGERLVQSRIGKAICDATFGAQYTAGAESEVIATAARVKEMGMKLVLIYAREGPTESEEGKLQSVKEEVASLDIEDVKRWMDGNLKTIQLSEPGHCIAVKLSGAGDAVNTFLKELGPSKYCHEGLREEDFASGIGRRLLDSLFKICESAKARDVRILMDAEHQNMQDGIDGTTLLLQKKYNVGSVVVYNTYQMYLKKTPRIFLRHLIVSRSQNFTMCFKLVRGAYMGSEPAETFWASKVETDFAYDDAVSLVFGAFPIQDYVNKYAPDFQIPEELFSSTREKQLVDMIIASHNTTSCHKALALWKDPPETDATIGVRGLAFAQLMGMAEELTLSLCEVSTSLKSPRPGPAARKMERAAGFDVYQYTVWGSTAECLLYMCRRAEENLQALDRSIVSRNALFKELRRRIVGSEISSK